MSEAYDYIIVGAGSAGCVLANRLSADPGVRVLLLEAGPRDWNPFIHMPAGLSKLMRFKSLNWGYETEPEPGLDNRRLYWPRGRVLGGSSSINAMCYIRGHRADYDAWAETAPGWNWDAVLPYFLRSENNRARGGEFHGDDGPLSVENLHHVNPLSEVYVQACEQAGLARNPDFNGASQRGVGLYQVTQIDGRRCSTATGYLDPVKHRRNLVVRTGARVATLDLEGRRARSVHYRHRGLARRAVARREILLCGGAINSPHLLMASGIGPAAELEAHRVPVRHELPSVGGNLQDHLDICTLTRCSQPITYDRISEIRVGLRYFLHHDGIGTSNIAEAGGFVVSRRTEEPRPDIQLHFVPALLDDHGRNRLPGDGYTLHACPLCPASRGRIRLGGSDPLTPPRIFANYLSEAEDLEMMLECLAVSREILSQPAFRPFRAHELLPGGDITERRDLIRYIRAKAETIYHPVGTCRMGSDAHAVVDTQLRVHGLEGLRVIDASVMPKLVSGNTNAPTIMIAEKAADMILGAAGSSEAGEAQAAA